ncbi:HET-domain-containing protein, partial [Lepidopterella palustris CBS 459.81]
YEPLDTSSSQIRLVQVSSTTGVAIRCAIETFDLDTYPEYEALSYTWGPPPPTRTIFLNGQQFHVRENLWCFLDHVARNSIASLAGVEFEPRYLWIDQLSIDQSSTAEKSHQVRQMAQIFKQARRVVAWLGEEEAGSDAAMQLIGRAVGRLFRRRYWTRLWIVQELILAQDLIIACGNCAVPFVGVRMVDASLYLLDQRSFDVDAHGLLDLFPDQVRFLVIWTQDSPRQRRSPEMVPEVFMVYSGMECENPKDKVYALSAIVEGRLDITVDYSRPASWVYWDVM